MFGRDRENKEVREKEGRRRTLELWGEGQCDNREKQRTNARGGN